MGSNPSHPTKLFYMKQCTQCKQWKDESLFNKQAWKKDGLNIYCRECQRSRQRDYYEKVDRSKQIRRSMANNQQRVEKISRFILDFLLRHPCVDCGEVDPIVLTFDHVQGEKKFCISHYRFHTLSLKVVQEEIRKCEVRCVNCHTRRHFTNGDSFASSAKRQLLG